MDENSTLDTEAEADFMTHGTQSDEELLPQLVAHLREHRSRLREEWAARIQDAHLLQAMTPQ